MVEPLTRTQAINNLIARMSALYKAIYSRRGELANQQVLNEFQQEISNFVMRVEAFYNRTRELPQNAQKPYQAKVLLAKLAIQKSLNGDLEHTVAMFNLAEKYLNDLLGYEEKLSRQPGLDEARRKAADAPKRKRLIEDAIAKAVELERAVKGGTITKRYLESCIEVIEKCTVSAGQHAKDFEEYETGVFDTITVLKVMADSDMKKDTIEEQIDKMLKPRLDKLRKLDETLAEEFGMAA